MKEIKEHIAANHPAWVAKKQRQARPPEHIRLQNGRRPNCRIVELKPEYTPLQLPEA